MKAYSVDVIEDLNGFIEDENGLEYSETLFYGKTATDRVIEKLKEKIKELQRG